MATIKTLKFNRIRFYSFDTVAEMKIVSFNVNNDYRDILKNAKTIYDMITTYDLDVAGLQEITPSMYDALQVLLAKPEHPYHMSEKQSGSYFNVMISKFPDPFSVVPFSTTSMARSFVYQTVSQMTFVTTHLESAAQSQSVRAEQCRQVVDHLDDRIKNKDIHVIVFGDTNFTAIEERVPGMTNIIPKSGGPFTYDSLLNPNAQPPFRSNLDRFYVTNPTMKYDVTILTDVNFSDHFPILLSFEVDDCYRDMQPGTVVA